LLSRLFDRSSPCIWKLGFLQSNFVVFDSTQVQTGVYYWPICEPLWQSSCCLARSFSASSLSSRSHILLLCHAPYVPSPSPGRWLAMLTPKAEPYAGVTAVSAAAVRRRWAAGTARDVCAPETTFDPAACLAAMDTKLGPATLAAAAYVRTLRVYIVVRFGITWQSSTVRCVCKSMTQRPVFDNTLTKPIVIPYFIENYPVMLACVSHVLERYSLFVLLVAFVSPVPHRFLTLRRWCLGYWTKRCFLVPATSSRTRRSMLRE
jgi:hypothetical protein